MPSQSSKKLESNHSHKHCPSTNKLSTCIFQTTCTTFNNIEDEEAPTSKMESHTTNQPETSLSNRCYLLELPGELRNEIFGSALYHPEGVVIDCYARNLVTKHPLALTQTCKQIRKECCSLLFSQNLLRLQAFDHRDDNKERLDVFESFCQETLVDSRLVSTFRGVIFETGPWDIQQRWGCFTNPLLSPRTRPVFDACLWSGKELLWTFKVSSDSIEVVYSLDMKSKQSAMATADFSYDKLSALQADAFRLFHPILKEAIGLYFKDQPLRTAWLARARVSGSGDGN